MHHCCWCIQVGQDLCLHCPVVDQRLVGRDAAENMRGVLITSLLATLLVVLTDGCCSRPHTGNVVANDSDAARR